MKGRAHKILRRFRFQRTLRAVARRLRDLQIVAAPELIDLPAGSRLLVLAPHPDDESIGCGGTLAKWRDAGRSAKVVFLTDGRQGSRALRQLPEGDPGRVEAEKALIVTRQQEARLALQALGIDAFAFGDIPDGELGSHVGPGAKIIGAAIDDYRPDLIMLPFLTDRHPDHVAAGICLVAALKRLGSQRLEQLSCAGYEVWSPIQANTIIDISAWVDRKKSAIGVYQSQLRDTNYLDGALSLNRYRAVSNVIAGSHAEAFFIAPAGTYVALAG